jgi:multiple sugar transport system substrate-binding protein
MAVYRRRVLLGAAVGALVMPRRGRTDDAVVEIASTWGADKPFQKIVDAFNAKKSGVTAVNRYDGTYEETARKALASVAAGRPPDIMVTGWKFAQFARHALNARDFREIDAARADRLLANFVPSVHPLVTVEGAVIGLPWAMSTPITYLDLELWKAAGLDPAPPDDFDTTWLYDRARDMHKRLSGKHPTYRSAIDLSNNEWTSQSFIQNAGGTILGPDGQVTLDTEEARHGMELYCQPAREGLWIPVSDAEQITAFDAGAIGIVTTSSASSLSFAAPGHRPVITARFPAIPGHRRHMNSGGNFLAIYTHDQERALAAMSFLEFCASDEGQRMWSATGYLNTSVHDIPLASPLQAPAAAQLKDGLTSETVWPGSHGLQGQAVWRNWVTRMLQNDVSVAQGLSRARAELTPLLAT